MGQTTTADVDAGPGTDRRVRPLLLVSAGFLAVQVSVTDYGDDQSGAGVFWFAVGCGLLWLVDRRLSRVARAVVVVTSLAGAVMYGVLLPLTAWPGLLLMVAFLGQAVPLLLRPVRAHVQPAG